MVPAGIRLSDEYDFLVSIYQYSSKC